MQPISDSTPHRRFNPLVGEWVLVSPHRIKRPWSGQTEQIDAAVSPGAASTVTAWTFDEEAGDGTVVPAFDPGCYLCPGNTRVSGETNDTYSSTFVFTNDFRALLDPRESGEISDEPISGSSDTPDPFYRSEAVRGTCRVLCFSPSHTTTLGLMRPRELLLVVNAWIQQHKDLSSRFDWVQLFENRGTAMGCSNPHPHGQIWACDSLPVLPEKEDRAQREYSAGKEPDSILLLDYVARELGEHGGERVIVEGKHWVVVVPYWAVWPFEGLLLPRSLRIRRLSELDDDAEWSFEGVSCQEVKEDLCITLKRLFIRYDNLFECPFPLSWGWHNAPSDPSGKHPTGHYSHWQLHAHFYPCLLRSASVRKHMVGFELLAESQRDLTAEGAARQLRNVSDVIHYSQK